MRTFALAAALALAGCTSVRLPADPRAQLDPISFFSGQTHGDGRLHQVFAAPTTVRVDSTGHRSAAGGLLLTQRIAQDGKSPRIRQWIMQPAGPGRYTGSLTEAVGPVSLVVTGPRAEIRYRMKGGLSVQQQLALQADGRTLLNHLEVTKIGLRVAYLDETIRKLP